MWRIVLVLCSFLGTQTSLGHHGFDYPLDESLGALTINSFNGGPITTKDYWLTDCNRPGFTYHRWITAIWDDGDDFKDIDKIKCETHNNAIRLDVQDNVVIDTRKRKGDYVCPQGYVLTALHDDTYGFPHLDHIKCTKVIGGSVHDNTNDTYTVTTGGQSGGPSKPTIHWNVECGDGWAVVGVREERLKTTAVVCAMVSSPVATGGLRFPQHFQPL